MNITDVILIIPLVLSVIHGFRDGIILQLGGLIGIAIGIILAVNYSPAVSEFLGITSAFSTEISFVIIIAATMLVIGIAGWIINKVFNFVGLGLINKLGGAIIGCVKMIFILTILTVIFDNINRSTHFVEEKHLTESVIYTKLENISYTILPSMETLKNKLNFISL
ncbi:MAG: CvpA family protein [Rikenellaceae bacterium]|nr:CvpA family protein [Rikenellaceae bacterium]